MGRQGERVSKVSHLGKWVTIFLLAAIGAILFTNEAQAHDGAHSNDIEVNGTLSEVIESDAKKNIVRSYLIIEDSRSGQIYELKTRTLPDKAKALKAKTVKVKGHLVKRGGTQILSEADVTYAYAGSDLSSGGTTAEVGNGHKKVIALLLRTSDSATAEPWPLTAAREQVFTRVNNFYKEASYGKASITGDILGWETTTALSTECNFTAYRDAGNRMMAAAGLLASNYDIILYYISKTSCGWAGMATMGSGSLSSYINGNMPDDVVAHELGHNYGLNHASAYVGCTSGLGYNEPQGSCSTIEYGDHTDTMGNAQTVPTHFNAIYKEKLGWLTAVELPTITTTQTIAISPYAAPLDGRPKAIKVPRYTDVNTGETTYFYFEFRQPIGFDQKIAESFATYNNSIKGLTGHISKVTGSSNIKSFIFDATPGSISGISPTYDKHYDLYNSAIEPGQSFSYPYSGVKVTVNSATTTGAEATISFSTAQVDKTIPIVTSLKLGGVDATDGMNVVGLMSLTVESSDNVASSRVYKAYVNGKEFRVDPNVAYLQVDFATLPLGPVQIGGKAIDVFGNESVVKSVTVNNLGANLYPTGQMISPVANSVVTGNILLKADAKDDHGIKSVSFYVGTLNVGQVLTAPYELTWNSTLLTDGKYAVKAYIVDIFGKAIYTSLIYITINNSGSLDLTAPTVSFTAPANNSTLSGSITVNAIASDNVGVTQVNFLVDGKLQVSDTTAPYEFVLDSTKITDGTHNLSAVASDAAGNTTTTPNLTINVKNSVADTLPPSVMITSPQNGATISGAISIDVAASDNVAVAAVEIFIDGQLLCRDGVAPYSCAYSTPGGRSRSITITARAIDTSNNIQQTQIAVKSSGGGKSRK